MHKIRYVLNFHNPVIYVQLNCPTAEANLDRSPLKPVQVNVALWVPLNTNL